MVFNVECRVKLVYPLDVSQACVLVQPQQQGQQAQQWEFLLQLLIEDIGGPSLRTVVYVKEGEGGDFFGGRVHPCNLSLPENDRKAAAVARALASLVQPTAAVRLTVMAYEPEGGGLAFMVCGTRLLVEEGSPGGGMDGGE